ncbi:MAG TPA: hypothetical protein VMW10_08350 [Alphaproteobacteria bacterium]|nr:hypothetical protein [Alphaproteobacteria bacterium]
MIIAETKYEYYQALIDKKTEYEGVFLFGVIAPDSSMIDVGSLTHEILEIILTTVIK